MLTALEATLGIVKEAAEQAGISRQSHTNWLKNDPEYKARYEEIIDLRKDIVRGLV